MKVNLLVSHQRAVFWFLNALLTLASKETPTGNSVLLCIRLETRQ
jgi:hypothetical protein